MGYYLRMTITLDSRDMKYVKSMVRSKHYRSADAVVRDGIALLRANDEKLRWLREQIQKGIDDVENGRVHTHEQVMKMLRRKLELKKARKSV